MGAQDKDAQDKARIRVQVVRAWPRLFEAIDVVLANGATVADALAASGFDLADAGGYAIFGERAMVSGTVRDGDRIEILRPLQIDPKQARRQRAAGGRGR